MTFPGTLDEGRLFTGTGLRKKSILGLKKINVYAFGTCFTALIGCCGQRRMLFSDLDLRDAVLFDMQKT
jgi:hypothetical protein